MATLNKAIPRPKPKTHEGGPAVAIGPVAELRRSVMSCLLWEKEFYEDGATIASRIADLVAKCPPIAVVEIAIQAKADQKLRHVPLLLTRELMRTPEGRKFAKHIFPVMIRRPDDATEFLSIYRLDDKRKLPNQVKRHLGAAMRTFDEYQLAKYAGGSKAIHLSMVLRLCHPKPKDEAQAALWGRLCRGELATPDTWEVELSKSKDKKESWTRLLKEEKLGGLAMLRNLRNMTQAGVDPKLIRQGIATMNGRWLLPINYIAAARHAVDFEPDLEPKFFENFEAGASATNVPGRTVVLIDVSGSMDAPLSAKSEMRRLDVATSLAMIARETFENVCVYSFSDRLVQVPARRGFGLRDAILHSQGHNGTALGGAILAVSPCDRLIVITDEQAADAVPKPSAEVAYLINVASATHGVGYGKPWVHIDGWSDSVVRYIVELEKSASADFKKSATQVDFEETIAEIDTKE